MVRRLEAVPTWRVLATFVGLQWLLVLGLALVVRHNGWIYYQGGDQLWYWTLGWLFTHGSFTQPLVGYLWSILLAPIALAGGPNLAASLPAIVILNTVVLLPVALLSFYGIARLIAGRLFAYWALALWLVVPLFGIWFTEPGYHQRFTELLLPQSLGLTAMADFPTMVAVLVAAYFGARAALDAAPRPLDAAACGVAAGAAIGLKPSSVLFLAGPLLALLVARRPRHAALAVAAALPAVVALTIWKVRGYGYLPVVGAEPAQRLAAGPYVLGFRVPQYLHFDWQHFTRQLDLLREHFWSARLIEWAVVAGAIGAARRSWRVFALVAGWFGVAAFVKAGFSQTSIEDTNLLRILIPSYPAFVLLLALLPFVVPGLPRRVTAAPPATTRLAPRTTLVGVVAGLILTAAVPLAVVAAVSPVRGTAPAAAAIQQPPVPVHGSLGLRAVRIAGAVRLSWTSQRPAGGAVFYHVFRTPAGDGPFSCPDTAPAAVCWLQATDIGTTRASAFVDRHPGSGRSTYRIGVAANWLDDPAYGDVYSLSTGVSG